MQTINHLYETGITLRFYPSGHLLFVQEYPEVSYSNSYTQQAFYRLSDNATTNIDNDSWEVAFSIFERGFLSMKRLKYLALKMPFTRPNQRLLMMWSMRMT
ncbi:MAG: hypothetical protein R2788_22385 [Saprospiraceae bacterium]